MERTVDETTSTGAGRLFGGILRQGFHLALLYAASGLVLELLHQLLPAPVYQRLAGAVYGLPMRLLAGLGLDSQLVGAMAQGRVPSWLAGAVVPAAGVSAILALALAIACIAGFVAMVGSLKQR